MEKVTYGQDDNVPEVRDLRDGGPRFQMSGVRAVGVLGMRARVRDLVGGRQ